jgi:hypothetical protein
MAKSVVRLNAKGEVIKDYAKWGVIADMVKYGVPIAYISTQFNIFTTQDARVQIGGGAILIGFVVWSFFNKKIKLAVEKYKKLADTKTNSTLFGVATITLAGVLTGVYFIIWQTVYLLLVFGVSSLIGDLVFRSRYYSMKKVYDKAVALQQENDLNQTMITFTQKGVQV